MMDILKYLMENSDERFTKQIQYIMDQLSQDPSKSELSKSQTLSESNEEDNDVDDLDEDDDLVEEEELEESIHLDKNIPLGEDLLDKYFLLPPEQAVKQSNLVKSAMKDQQKSYRSIKEIKDTNGVPFNRPTTPSLMSNNASIIEQSRDIPSEMKARPKILRTPMEGGVKVNNSNISNINNVSNLQNSFEEKKDENGQLKAGVVINLESPFMNEKKIELRVYLQN